MIALLNHFLGHWWVVDPAVAVSVEWLQQQVHTLKLQMSRRDKLGNTVPMFTKFRKRQRWKAAQGKPGQEGMTGPGATLVESTLETHKGN